MDSLSVGQIVLRKNENFWIFPRYYMYSEKLIYSPWFSYMGGKWRLVKYAYQTSHPGLKFHMWRKLRPKLSKCSYVVQLNLPASNCRGVLSSGEIDPDFGFEFDTGIQCSCNKLLSDHYFQQNGLVKLFFDIQKIENINNATEQNNETTLKGDEENGEDEESSENENDGSSQDEESDDNILNINNEGSNEDKTVAAGGIKKLAENLKQVFLDERVTDAVLKVANREFKVHKVVLVAQSPVFASMFEHDLAEKNTNVVDIPDCAADSFEVFLYYLYSGNAEALSSNNVYNVYYAADKYRVDDLKERCVEFMKTNLSVETFCDTISLSLRHGESKLQKAAIRFFCKNMKKIIKTVQWQQYMEENSTQANELIIKAVKA